MSPSGCTCRAKSGITTPDATSARGNILVWEQPLSERLRSQPVVSDVTAGVGVLDARMDAQSILYTTLWLFGVTFVAVVIVFGGVIWWVVRKKERAG